MGFHHGYILTPLLFVITMLAVCREVIKHRLQCFHVRKICSESLINGDKYKLGSMTKFYEPEDNVVVVTGKNVVIDMSRISILL